jgi:hypothetical protein
VRVTGRTTPIPFADSIEKGVWPETRRCGAGDPQRHCIDEEEKPMSEMTPRQRVQTALMHQEPDRVPLDIGGVIDSQYVLPYGSVADVEAEVRRRVHDLGPGGSFVVASVHNIQPDMPPENIVALADATRRYGVYPLAS